MHYVVFVAVFIAVMGIISAMFLRSAITQEIPNSKNSKFLSVLAVTTDILNEIPIIGSFWNLIVGAFTFIYIHPYLALILSALLGAPLGYIILRLLRGGG